MKYPSDLIINHLISCIQLHKEVDEVLDCLPWKFERDMAGASRERLLEELVDVFKYFNRLLFIHDVSENEFQTAFDKKSDIVERRLCDGNTYCMDKSLSKTIQ